MVNIGEKLSDIAFQNPAGSRIVFADNVSKFAESVDRLMRPLVQSAGIRIGDKSSIKKRVKDSVNGVVEQPVPDGGFMDIPRLRVGYIERLISAVAVC